MKTGTIVTVNFLNKNYAYWKAILRHGYLDQLPRDRGERRKFIVLKDLPELDAYLTMKVTHFTTTVGDLISDAFSEAENLADEMQSWYDSLPEGFQASDKGERIQEASDTLSNIQTVDVPDIVAKLSIVFYPGRDLDSRRSRAAEAAGMMRTAAEEIRSFVDENSGEDGNEEKNEEADGIDVDELQSLADELESAADESEGVEFPGMYD